MKKDWIYHTNVYEINTRQYTHEGTFKAFAQHLPRLKDMGVQILWFMPVTPISEVNRKGTLGSYYSCSSYTDINPHLGSLDDLKLVIQQAHELGFKVIIDWVANHTGCDHHWTTEHPDWYVTDEHGNFVEVNGWDDAFDLNYKNDEMRAAMIEAMQYWIKECDIDGFRCDMAHLVPLDFWIDAQKECEKLKDLFWLAETDEKKYHEVFDVSYAWKWMHASENFYKQKASLAEMQDVQKKYNEYPEGAFKLYFTANHDENSHTGTEYEKYGDAARLFAVFTAIYKGVPLVYSGQELPNMKRLLFFDKDEIDWKNHAAYLHDFYKSLLNLRNSNAFSKEAEIIIISSGISDDIFCQLRICGKSKVLSLLNFSAASRLRFTLNHPALKETFKNIFSNLEFKFSESQQFELQSWEYLVFSCG